MKSLTDNRLDLIGQHSVSHASNDSEGIDDKLKAITNTFSQVLANQVINVACYNSKMTKEDLGEEKWLALVDVVQMFAKSSVDELINLFCNRYLNYL